MANFLDELAEIYFESPTGEKKRLKLLFNKAFRGTKKQVNIKSQDPYLEYQVHLRTLLCFGYIDNMHRHNHWTMFIPTDIKLLISIYYPDVFKAPIGVYLGTNLHCCFEVPKSTYGYGWTTQSNYNTRMFDINSTIMSTNTNQTTVTTPIFDINSTIMSTSRLTTNTDIAWNYGTAFLSPSTTQERFPIFDNSTVISINTNQTTPTNSLFDMFDIGGCSINMSGVKNIAFNAIKFVNNSLYKTNQLFNARIEEKTDNMNYQHLQMILSRKASIDDIFCNKLDKMNDLFIKKTVNTGFNIHGMTTKHIIIACVKQGIEKILNIFKEMERRYENMLMLSKTAVGCIIVLVTMTTAIITITVKLLA